MFNPKELDPTESPFKFLGSEIRRLRCERGLSVDALAGLVFVSKGYISQFETGARKPELAMVERIDNALRADGHLLVVYRMALKAGESAGALADYFAAVADLEPTAKRIDWYGASLFPGLLQTLEYATEITRKAGPFRTDAEVKELVNARMERKAKVLCDGGPKVLVILDESAVRRCVGPAEVMRDQLTYVADLVRANRIVVQVLPFSAGAHPLLSGQLIIMRFRDAPPVAYVEAPHAGMLMEEEETVDACLLSYDLARAAALSPEASLVLIESAAKEYTT